MPPARRFVEGALEQWGLAGAAWTATLLVSELAANAALHAGTDFTVVLERTDGAVRLEVHDGSPVVPRQRRHSREATTGRGLLLVADLADDWGIEPAGTGKVVWVELSTSRTEAADPADDVDVDALLAAFGDEADAPGAGPQRPPLSLAA